MALLAASWPSAAAGQAPRQPNVVLVVAEGLGLSPGCYGGEARTPHIDRLAKRGRLFEQAFTVHPAAGPARASLLTGLEPRHTRVWDGEAAEAIADAVLLPERLRADGYFTARVGSLLGGAAEAEVAWDVVGELEAAGDVTGSQPAAVAEGILATRPAKPLLLAVGLRPALLPSEMAVRFDPSRTSPAAGLTEPRDYPLAALGDLGFFMRPGHVATLGPAPLDMRQQALAAQLAYAAYVDAQLGQVTQALDRLKLLDDTVVVLVGVAPADLGARGTLPRPDTLFEERLRIPLIVSTPRMPQAGKATKAVVELTDVYPTLLDLAGALRPDSIDGVTLASLLQDPQAAPVRAAALAGVSRMAGQIGRSVRTPRFRYTEWPDGSEELYDHEADPREESNQAGSLAHAETLRELRARVERPQPPPQPSPPPVPSGRKLNVLMIVLDDLNVRLGSYGYPVSTPNIDRLARMGRRFDRAYAQVAMCNPSRASFLSGRSPERLASVWTNADAPRPHLEGAVPIQEHFAANGYYTAYVGKVWETDFAEDFRWDFGVHVPPLPAGVEDKTPRRRNREFDSQWAPTGNADENEPDGLRARAVARLLEEHRTGPFFIAAGFVRPHLRWLAPQKYFDLYPPEQVSFIQAPPDDGADIPLLQDNWSPTPLPGLTHAGRTQEPADPALVRQAIAAYQACVSFADAQVGVLLEALDRLKLWDTTVVVLFGDNGHHLGEHLGLWRKDTLFEEALRVPLIIAGPQVQRPGEPTAGLAELIDVYPTLTDMAGVPRPAALDGVSLLPLLEDPARGVRDAAYSFRRTFPPERGFSLRTARHRYTLWPDGSSELYDLQTDSLGLVNVAGDPEQAELLREMRRLLAERLGIGPVEPPAPEPAERER
jgi:uncharacterized sulfatase